MAKIQVYVNDNVAEKINAIAVQRRAEGAKEKDISYSSMVKTQFTVNKVLGIECLSPHVNGNPKWEWSGLIENIRDDVSAVMEKFFPNESEIEDE